MRGLRLQMPRSGDPVNEVREHVVYQASCDCADGLVEVTKRIGLPGERIVEIRVPGQTLRITDSQAQVLGFLMGWRRDRDPA